MKKRYLYSILFGVPGFIVSLIVAFILFGFVAGFLWLYVYGDETWPASAESILPILFVICFMTLWVISLLSGYHTGKRLEATPGLNQRHILGAVVATILPVVLIVFHQTRTGSSGATIDSVLCSEYCSNKGYSTSGMPPKDSGDRSCSCLDGMGQAAVTVPMDSVISDDPE